MGSLKIHASVVRAESVRDLSKSPQGMCKSRRRPPCVRVQSSELSEDVTQLPDWKINRDPFQNVIPSIAKTLVNIL